MSLSLECSISWQYVQSSSQLLPSGRLESFVKLAHELGVLVIAQHVQTGEQAAQLAAAGVDAASGLFFAAPH